jgi:hypothetical protein
MGIEVMLKKVPAVAGHWAEFLKKSVPQAWW